MASYKLIFVCSSARARDTPEHRNVTLYIDLTTRKVIHSIAQHSRVGGQFAEVVGEVKLLCSGDAVQHSLVNLSSRFLLAD